MPIDQATSLPAALEEAAAEQVGVQGLVERFSIVCFQQVCIDAVCCDWHVQVIDAVAGEIDDVVGPGFRRRPDVDGNI